MKQRQFRLGMHKPNLVRIPVLAVIPPFAVTGKVHLPPKSDLSLPEYSGLARFFPLTDAVLFTGEERVYQGPIVLLNRDLLAMVGRTGEDIQDRPPPGSASRITFDEVIATLNQPVMR